MRGPDQPLPGDIVIKCRQERTGVRLMDTWIVTRWPHPHAVIGGPYQSYGYALRQARAMGRDPDEWIWRDHARAGDPEQLELVVGADGQCA
jgi:hypothetical protein